MHNSHKIIIVTICVLAILAISLTLIPKFSKSNITNTESSKNPDAIILKVGQENIYQKDFDYELKQLPKTEQKTDIASLAINQKLVNDSISIQQAVLDKFITVDNSVYNSNTKNYTSRIQTVNLIQKIVNSKADRLEGSVITIWFNNSIVPKMGILKAKDLTKSKIDNIQSAVKNKTLTVQEAVDKVKKDTSLQEIDAAYQPNSSLSFNAVYGDKITIDKDYDTSLWTLKQGEVGDVIALKSTYKNPTSTEEILYAFAIISKRTTTGQKNDYDSWLKENSTKYEITK